MSPFRAMVERLLGDAPPRPFARAAAARLALEPAPLYAVVDAARDPRIGMLLSAWEGRFESLYDGEQGALLAPVAPYLVALPPGEPLLQGLLAAGWGDAWGVFVTSRRPPREVRRHLRRFLLAETDAGRRLVFRFYDPRVLRVFAATITPRQHAELLRELDAVLLEGPGPDALHRLSRDGLERVRLAGGGP